MRVLLPDLPAFHALAQPGDTFLPGAELAFYSNDTGVPEGEAQGVVLWLANGATRDALLNVPGAKEPDPRLGPKTNGFANGLRASARGVGAMID